MSGFKVTTGKITYFHVSCPKFEMSAFPDHATFLHCYECIRGQISFFLLLSILGQLWVLVTSRGDVKIPHSRMKKTCWETLVTCL